MSDDSDDDSKGRTRTPRPSVASEMRAWIGVGIVILVNMVGSVWWAATLSADLRQVRETLAEFKILTADRYSGSDANRDSALVQRQFLDHENRIRDIERSRYRPR